MSFLSDRMMSFMTTLSSFGLIYTFQHFPQIPIFYKSPQSFSSPTIAVQKVLVLFWHVNVAYILLVFVCVKYREYRSFKINHLSFQLLSKHCVPWEVGWTAMVKILMNVSYLGCAPMVFVKTQEARSNVTAMRVCTVFF